MDHALTTFGMLSGISENELDSRIWTALERVGIADLRHKKINPDRERGDHRCFQHLYLEEQKDHHH